MSNLTKKAYIKIIEEDIVELCAVMPINSLEKRHIIEVLTWSIDALYPSPTIEEIKSSMREKADYNRGVTITTNDTCNCDVTVSHQSGSNNLICATCHKPKSLFSISSATTFIQASPSLNGLKCPKCNEALYDKYPNTILTSDPAQKHTVCLNEACKYEGYRFI